VICRRFGARLRLGMRAFRFAEVCQDGGAYLIAQRARVSAAFTGRGDGREHFNLDRSGARPQGVARQDLARAADGDWHHREPGAGSGEEGAEMKSAQARFGTEGAFGKHRERHALTRQLDQVGSVVHRTFGVEAFYKYRSQPHEQPAEDRRFMASRLMTKPKRGGSAAVSKGPSR